MASAPTLGKVRKALSAPTQGKVSTYKDLSKLPKHVSDFLYNSEPITTRKASSAPTTVNYVVLAKKIIDILKPNETIKHIIAFYKANAADFSTPAHYYNMY